MVPQHIGMIMDGNRRFSKRLMLKPWKGHEWGAKKIEEILGWFEEFGIHELTLYTLSVQNFERPKEEFDFLMKLFREKFDEMINDERFAEKGIRVNIVGRLWMLPDDIQKKAQEIMDKTKDNDQNVLNFAMAYGGREEVMDAVKRIAEQVKSGNLDVESINEEVFADNLYMESEPELIIRTGGDHRTSNFLLWQSHYSEWFFIDKLWPEFSKEDFKEVLEQYAVRQRRFGK